MWSPSRPNGTKVMVFQYGKVASTSVVLGLKVYADLHAAHAHTADQAEAWLEGKATGITPEQQGFALSEEWSLKPGDRCYIITMTRSHFTRDPSEFFENVVAPGHPYAYPNMEAPWDRGRVAALAKANMSALVEHYLRQHLQVTAHYSTWFTEVFKTTTDIDVLRQPFDFEKKMSVVKGSVCTAIVVRFEDIRSWQGIFQQFFPQFKMDKENRAEDKWYLGIYKEFVGRIHYSKEQLNAMCNTETERYFYKGTAGSKCP